MEFVTCVKYSLDQVKFQEQMQKVTIAVKLPGWIFFSQNTWSGFVFEKKFDNLFKIDD